MPAMIEVLHLHKKYGNLVAVEDVSFTVEEGEVFGILGPAGAGKSTIVECIEGLRNPDGGEINVLGRDPYRERAEITRRLDVQLRNGRPADRLRVAEALSLYSSFYRKPADWRELMDAVGLMTEARTPVGTLSGGKQQRLSVALALVGNPQVAIFDEFTTGLDPRARRDAWELIETVRDSGVTILLTTQSRAEAERLCDRVALMDQGRISVIDTPDRLNRAGPYRRESSVQFRSATPLGPALGTAR